MGRRSFQQASVVATGVQTCEGRFGKRGGARERHDRPTVSQWRCNLTALSHTRNLFFASYGSQIYVYVPQYSTHALPAQPALIVSSQPSSAGLRGYLDPTNPHSINNLVVQFLGSEEVVAAVRDDGDVDAFLVRHIVHAIESRAELGSRLGSTLADEVKPFFHENVGKSAWGLAIHSQARILAVSANTHAITVFKFGLVGLAATSSPHASAREKDVTHRVYNGTSNIPYISFCNTGDDPQGKWLLTTDISGFCRSIDLDAMQLGLTFRFGAATNPSTSHDRFNSGWTIMFLDRKSFIPEQSFHAAVGLNEDETLPGLQHGSRLWDIGATASHLSDCSDIFSPGRRPSCYRIGARLQPVPSLQAANVVDEGGAPPGQEAPGASEDPAAADDEGLDAYFERDDAAELEYLADQDMLFDQITERSPSFFVTYGGRRISGCEPRTFDKDGSLCGDLPCPILHASVRSVYLVQPSNQRRTGEPFTPPTVGFTNALHQFLPPEFAWLDVYERLNMNVYIPAIGIVVLASQKGRAVVLSLTKLSPSACYPAELQGVKAEEKTKYAMRIEKILPYACQERRKRRPFAPLLGIAAGPVQGTERLPDEQKRWRLMLTYTDHSILSYEIGRRGTRDSAVDLGAVIV